MLRLQKSKAQSNEGGRPNSPARKCEREGRAKIGERSSREPRLQTGLLAEQDPLLTSRLPLDCIRMVGQPCRKRSEAYFFFHCWLKNKKHLPNGFQSDESCQGQTMSGEEL